jgi:hypothetical protein
MPNNLPALTPIGRGYSLQLSWIMLDARTLTRTIPSTGEELLVHVGQASQAAEKVVYFVIPSEARNLSSI